MNILYLGPYRSNNNDGYESLNYLLELQQAEHNIVSRPVYDHNSSILKIEEAEEIINKCENNKISNFDLLIQHLNIDNLDHTSIIKKKIYIPIFNNNLCNFEQKQKILFLINKGKFIIRNEYHKLILDDVLSYLPVYKMIKPSINKKIFSSNREGSFNFGLYNKYKKYYSILDQSDEHTIKELMVSFVRFFSTSLETNICLIIFLQNINKPRLDYYNNYIKDIYKTFNINYSINKIILAPIELNKSIISTIHSTGDIFIDIKQDIHSSYARFYNKILCPINLKLSHKSDPNNLSSEQKISYFFSNDSINFNNLEEIANSDTITLTTMIERYA